MAGLVGIYATKSKVHNEFKLYGNDSVLNYVSGHLRLLTGRGKESLKYTFFKNGKQKIIAGPYRSDVVPNKIKDVEVLKATGLITKVEYEKLGRSLSTTSIDGYFINKDELKKGPHEERFRVFDRKFSNYIENHDYEEAMRFANLFFNGSLIKETEDSIIGLRTATGYKPLYLMEAENDDNQFTTMSSEDCVKTPFINLDINKKAEDFGGMDVLKTSSFRRGQLIWIDKDGNHSITDTDNPSGDALRIEASYDPHEPIYIMNKNSTWEGKPVVKLRKKIGENLFWLYQDELKESDLIGYVPDSPIDIAIGMQIASGIPNDEVLQKDRYNRRSPQRGYGDRGQSDLYLMSEEILKGKDVIVVDDSIIEANHLKVIKSRCKDHARKIRVVSAEIPIIKEEQAGFYSEERELLARNIFSDKNISKISDFNDEVSRWAEMNVYYNTSENIAKSLEVKLDNLEVPSILKHMIL